MRTTEPAPSGLRFVHPSLDTSGPGGLVCADTGRLELVGGDASVRQSLLLLLSTYPGERVMRPDYGCELLTLAFAQNDETTAGLAIHFVRQAVERFEPRARIVRLSATRPPAEPHVLEVVLEYLVRHSGTPDVLTVSIPLDGSRQEV